MENTGCLPREATPNSSRGSALQTRDTYDAGSAMRFALEHQNPLIAGEITGGEAYPETEYALLSADAPDAIVWALKPSDDEPVQATLVRLWNLSNSTTDARLQFSTGAVRRVQEASHIETPIRELAVEDGALKARLVPHQIKTYLVRLTGESADLMGSSGCASDDSLPSR